MPSFVVHHLSVTSNNFADGNIATRDQIFKQYVAAVAIPMQIARGGTLPCTIVAQFLLNGRTTSVLCIFAAVIIVVGFMTGFAESHEDAEVGARPLCLAIVYCLHCAAFLRKFTLCVCECDGPFLLYVHVFGG